MSYGKPFGYTEQPFTCIWCGGKLKFSRKWEEPGANLRAQVVAAFEEADRLIRETSDDEYPGTQDKPIKHPDLGWISGGTHYPRVYNGIVSVGPRGTERQQSAGKPGTCDEDDHFCSGQCAQEFGRRAGELGYRLTRK